jgi:hypothetical protein
MTPTLPASRASPPSGLPSWAPVIRVQQDPTRIERHGLTTRALKQPRRKRSGLFGIHLPPHDLPAADGPAPRAPWTVHSASRTSGEPIEIPIPCSVFRGAVSRNRELIGLTPVVRVEDARRVTRRNPSVANQYGNTVYTAFVRSGTSAGSALRNVTGTP